MANRWGTMEIARDCIFLGSKVTADGDCSHEIKRHLLLGRKAMNNLDSILKSRDITLLTKVHLVKAMIFPVVMWGLDHKEGRMPKNWCIWTVVLEKTLCIPWTARSSNKFILKEISPGYSLEGQMLKLKFQYFSHQMRSELVMDREACMLRSMWSQRVRHEEWLNWTDAKSQLIGKDPDAGKDWRKEEKRMTENKMVAWYQWLNAHEFVEQALGGGGGQVSLAWSMGLQSPTRLSDWTATNPWRFLDPHRSLY